MDFRIADTVTDRLAILTEEEQKAATTTAFALQINPTAPGLRFIKLEKPKAKNFWSVQLSGDIRLIVHMSRAACNSVAWITTTKLTKSARLLRR